MLVQNRHMFPLKLVSSNIGDNYFMSADGKIFSTRTSNKPVELSGSITKSGTYFRFGNQWGSGFRLDYLKRQAMAHPRWTQEIMGPVTLTTKVAEAPASTAPANRSHASSVDAGIKAKGSVIARVHKGNLVFGSEPKIHTTEQSVKDEMIRLAAAHPGVKYVRLNIAMSVVAGAVVWE